MVTAAAAAPHVVVIAAGGLTGSLRVLVERLAGLGIDSTLVSDVTAAAMYAARTPENPPCVFLDLRDAIAADPADGAPERAAAEAVHRVRLVLPQCTPVVITDEASAQTVVACVRAGAADLLDLALEGTAAARQVVARVWQRQRARHLELAQAQVLRGMVEDLLKDLIKTERRSLALEDKVTAYRRQTRELEPMMDVRPATVVLVDPDRKLTEDLANGLEAAGVTAYAFLRGEDAVAHVASRLPGAPTFDLAVVAAQLPGIDGLGTIGQLRDRFPGLPAFLVTAVHDGELAARAADQGVVGFVHKPVEDVGELVDRLATLARDALGRAREHSYLERIKTRHERVLARYRALPRDPGEA